MQQENFIVEFVPEIDGHANSQLVLICFQAQASDRSSAHWRKDRGGGGGEMLLLLIEINI